VDSCVTYNADFQLSANRYQDLYNAGSPMDATGTVTGSFEGCYKIQHDSSGDYKDYED
jgi:hypothetical protein